MSDDSREITIKSGSRVRLVDWKELSDYRDLFRFLIWRDIKVRYAQSSLGIGWAIAQPLFSMIVFTIVFGRVAQISSDGVPYAIFSFTALVPWTYFSNSLTEGINSLVSNANMLGKVYFPRILLPISTVVSKLLDFAIAMVLLVILLVWFGICPTIEIFMLPVLILLMILTSAGLAMWLSALAIQYRDVKHGSTFVVQLLMYAAPVVYPTSAVPEKYQLLYAVNPLVGVIEGFRSALLGTQPMPYLFVAIGFGSSILIFATGLSYFRRRERVFADVA